MARAKQTYSYVEEWKKGWEPELEAIAYNGATCDPTRVDPKVLQWVKDKLCSSQGQPQPHFVKIINPNAANGRPGLLLKNSGSLTVPSPFVREHFRKLARVVTLEDDRGTRQWRVSFGAPKRDPQWLQGWDRVAADNNFQPGDVVVFVLVDDSRFRFTHFDADGNLRAGFGRNVAAVKPEFDVRRCSSSQESREQVHSVDDDAAAAYTTNTRALVPQQANRPTSEESPSWKERQLQRTAFDPFAFSIKSKRRVTTVVERKRAQDAAMAFAYTLTQAEQAQPHFLAIMSPTQVYHEFHMVVPESFVTKACLPAMATSATRLLLQDGGGGHSWEMLMKRNRNSNGVYFHRKLWALFALHHLLEDGDVCVFRLPTNQPANQASQARPVVLVLVVHMFRVVPVSTANQAGNQVSPHDHFALHKLGSETEQLGDAVTRERCSGEEKTGKHGTKKPCAGEEKGENCKICKNGEKGEKGENGKNGGNGENGETATRKRKKP